LAYKKIGLLMILAKRRRRYKIKIRDRK